MDWDRDLLRLVAAHRTGWLDILTRDLMTAGMSPLTYVAALLLCLLFGWVFHAWRATVSALAAPVVAVQLADLAKHVVGRPRPPAALALVATDGLAMPSSIAAMTAAAAVPVVLAARRSGRRAGKLVAAALVVVTVVVGLSMVYLGAHWASDVAVGWALGVAVGSVALAVLSRVLRPRRSASA